MSTALVRCCRMAFPEAQIDMIVRADFIDLIKDNPHLNQKIPLARSSGLAGLWELKKRINAESYDLIYDAHRSLRTLFLMPFLKARFKAYFKKYYIRRDLTLLFKVNLLRGAKRFLERYVEPLKPWGVEYDGNGPEVFVSEATRSAVEAKGLLPGSEERHWIGFIPSAQWPGKRWPPERFRQVLERLLAETAYGVIIFGGKSDAFCREISQGLESARVVNTQGTLSIAESAALLTRCDFVVANDTGLMHVADGLNLPSVLILGPTSKELGCLPFHPASEIVERELWCRPCSKNGQAPCIRGKRVCLDEITPDLVMRAIRRVRTK
jgi:lipopolysaccharide heptosyltransferase II